MKYLIAVLFLASALLAQPITFRSNSTSGLIPDDLDTWLGGLLYTQPVPDRLVDVEGHRLYTGLSNLSTRTDQALDESGDGEGGFTLGGSAALPGSAMGIGGLGQFFDRRIFEDISLPGPGGTILVSGSGEVEGSWSEFVDEDGDGAYDTRHTVHSSASGWADSTGTAMGVFAGWKPGSLSLGLGAALISGDVADNPSALNFSQTVTDTNLTTGTPTHLLDSAGEGTETESSDVLMGVLSGSGAVSYGVVGHGMFMFQSISGNMESSRSTSGVDDNMPGQPDVLDVLTWDTSQDFSVDLSGTTMGGGAGADWDWGGGWRMEIGAAGYVTSLEGSTQDYVAGWDSLYQLTAGGLLQTTSGTGAGAGDLAAKQDDTLIRAGSKITAEFESGLVVSFGAFFRSDGETLTNTTSSSMTAVETYDDGDSQFADPDDYTATSTWSQTTEEKVTTSLTRISLPVGLEFPIIPRLVGRLGADPAFVWEKETTTNTLLDASPVTTVTEYGDGSGTEDVEDPWTTWDGTLVNTDDSRTEIPFSYGLGFTPADQLQIDLMGVGRNLSEWRISATLLF
jgi:hypothetical protein